MKPMKTNGGAGSRKVLGNGHLPSQICVKRTQLAGGAVLLTPQAWSWGAVRYLKERQRMAALSQIAKLG